MPANYPHQTIYLGQRGSFDKFNEASLYKPGELGMRSLPPANLSYQLVQLDSGATSATTLGVVAANQLAFWKDKSKYLVTNDTAQAIGGQGGTSQFRNEVAGVFRGAITAGNYCWILQAGRGINVKSAAVTYVAGDWVIANTGTAADVTVVTAGTAPGVVPLGKASDVRSGANVPVDLDLPGID